MGPGDTDVDTLLEELLRDHALPGGPGRSARGSVPPPPPPPRPKVPEYLLSPEEKEKLTAQRRIERLSDEVYLLKEQVKSYEEQIELRDEEKNEILKEYIAVQTQLDELRKTPNK